MPLTKTYEALEHIANTKGSKAKEVLVNEYLSSIGRDFYLTIKYALEPTMKFNMTGIPSVKYYFENSSSEDIFSILKTFSQQHGVKAEQKKHLSMHCPNKETRDVVHRILEGNLRCGVGKEIAKKFIPDFTDPAVQLCYHRAEYLKNYDTIEGSLNTFIKKAGGWKNVVAHIKLDGTRIKTVKGNHFSRSGLHVPFYKFMNDEIDLFRESLKKVLGYTNDFVFELDGGYMYEGELNPTATDFSSIKNINIDKLYYHVFDIPNLYLPLEKRLEAIEKAVKESGCKKIKYIETFSCVDHSDMLRLFKEVIENGHRGLILKDKNGYYDPRKSGQWCSIIIKKG